MLYGHEGLMFLFQSFIRFSSVEVHENSFQKNQNKQTNTNTGLLSLASFSYNIFLSFFAITGKISATEQAEYNQQEYKTFKNGATI